MSLYQIDETKTVTTCICPRLTDTGGYRVADLACPVHGVDGTEPGDGYWEDTE